VALLPLVAAVEPPRLAVPPLFALALVPAVPSSIGSWLPPAIGICS
jgi:hypothetical protein